MRPVNLKMEGFTCYRTAQEIDFTQLHLFAIAGPTGSGKSSLLDAITFALYGKVPRLGGQNLDEFVSLGASRAAVTLDFEVQGKLYRVVRTMPRSGARRAQLEEIGGVTLGDQIGEVNERVRALLGLEYDAFVQSVLLPQGDFAKFLKGKPAEQRKILSELLRLGVYGRMRELAAKEAGELQVKIDAAEAMLNGPYAGATEKNLEDKEASLLAARGQRDEVAMGVEKLRGEFDRAKTLRARVEERDQLRVRQAELERKQPEVDAAKQEIERAERAAAVIEMLDDAAAKANEVQALRHSASELETKLAKASKDTDVKAAALRDAEAEAAALPVKRERMLKLAEVIPAAKERADWAGKLTEMLKKRDKLREDLAEQQATLEKASADLHSAQKHRDELQQQRAGVGYDAAVHTILANARAAAFALSSARENARNAAAPLASARQAAEHTRAALQEKDQAWKHAEYAFAGAERQLRDAAEALEAIQNQHRAAVLRTTLEPGCTCPVCEQPVKKVPASGAPAALQEAEQKKREAEGEKSVASKRADAARQAMMRAQASSDAAQLRVSECEEQAGNARRKLEESEHILHAAIAPFAAPADVLLEVFFEEEFAVHDDRKRLYDALTNELAAAENVAVLAKVKALKAESVADTYARQLTDLNVSIAEAEHKIEEYAAKVDAACSDDPEQESQKIQAEITRIEQLKDRSKKAHDEAMQTRHAAEVESTQKRAELAAAETALMAARMSADNALASAAFADEAAVRSARRPVEQFDESKQRVKKHEEDVVAVAASLTTLEAELAGVQITNEDVGHAAKAVEDAETRAKQIDEAIGTLKGEIKKLREDVAKANELLAELKANQARHDLVYRLSLDLKSDGFQQFVLDRSFRELVDGASGRLRQLNDRYDLVFKDNGFSVADHDHGGELRLADTLSGGETFLVSLALALELSEQIQQKQGSVRLDSLFIDEGFGTLDPETLDTVADAIESLGRTDRMVGVITHVAELHRRLPRLEVRPGANGSTVHYVED